jgi:hypothetical protein
MRERHLNSLLALAHFNDPKDTTLMEDVFVNLKKVREYNPVLLHHDAITGTHGSSVNGDYKRML